MRRIRINGALRTKLYKKREYIKGYETLIQSTNDGIFQITPNGDYIFANKAYLDRKDKTLEEVIGNNYCLFHSEDSTKNILTKVKEVIEKKESLSYEEHASDGKYILRTLSPIFSNEEISSIMIVAKDISEIKHAQNYMREQSRKDSINILASGFTHDFSNSLTGIINNIYLAKMLHDKSEISDEKIKKHIETALMLCDNASKVINKIRTLYTNNPVNMKRLDLHDVVSEVYSLLKNHPIEKKMTIKQELLFNKSEFFVEADYFTLSEALYNIGLNAIESIEKRNNNNGKIAIKVEYNNIPNKLLDVIHKEDYLHVKISDNGCGIRKDIITKIFDPYFSTKDMCNIRGQGLGLSTTQSIITNHKGFIEVESKANIGTIVNIYLPRNKDNIKTKEVKNIYSPDSKILVIDDDKVIRNVAKDLLELNEYKCLIAKNGYEGIEIYKTNKEDISLVVLDLTMPDINGSIVLEKIIEINPDAKVLISSGHSDVAHELNGHVGILNKPYRANDFISKIEEVMKK